jgi:hypothetical protein
MFGEWQMAGLFSMVAFGVSPDVMLRHAKSDGLEEDWANEATGIMLHVRAMKAIAMVLMDVPPKEVGVVFRSSLK